jgi:hypothetical protein
MSSQKGPNPVAVGWLNRTDGDLHTCSPCRSFDLFEQAILLFERACVAHDIDLEFASNINSARMILGVSQAHV